MERSEDRRGSRQVAFCLRDSRLLRKRVYVVRCYIENLIKLSHCFGKTTKRRIGKCMRRKQVDVARVEALGFVKIRLALVPLAAPACDKSQRFGNLAAIGQELTRLLKVMHRGVVIL